MSVASYIWKMCFQYLKGVLMVVWKMFRISEKCKCIINLKGMDASYIFTRSKLISLFLPVGIPWDSLGLLFISRYLLALYWVCMGLSWVTPYIPLLLYWVYSIFKPYTILPCISTNRSLSCMSSEINIWMKCRTLIWNADVRCLNRGWRIDCTPPLRFKSLSLRSFLSWLISFINLEDYSDKKRRRAKRRRRKKKRMK